MKKPVKIARPPASAPANHDIHGYMPGRKEFETEFENDAEQMVGALEFSETDPLEEKELKLALLHIYNSILDKRLERKKFILDRGLMDFRKIQAIEKKRSKEEKEVLQKMRVFSKMLSESDFNLFMGGLLSVFITII
jgi:transcriptional adapter 2-alpha